jgi:hypothetical protein
MNHELTAGDRDALVGLLESDVLHANRVRRRTPLQPELTSTLNSESRAMLIDECEGPRIRCGSGRRREPDATASPIGAGKPHAYACGFEALNHEPFVRIRRACDCGPRIQRLLLPSQVHARKRENDHKNESDS